MGLTKRRIIPAAPQQPFRPPPRTIAFNAFEKTNARRGFMSREELDDGAMYGEQDAFAPRSRSAKIPAYSRGAPVLSMEQVLSRVHEAIYNPVWDAVKSIMHLETTSKEDSLAKRIIKFINRSAGNEELLTLEWDQLCDQLVQGAFGSFASSCGDCEWFHIIDLAPAMVAAAMVLLPAAGWRVTPQQVHQQIEQSWQGQQEKKTLDKVIWEMVEIMFGDDEKVRTKVYNAISRSHQPALERVLNDVSLMEESERVEAFMRYWIEDGGCRAWGGLHEQAEEILSQENLVQMFDHLLQPFGEEHPFSAVPRVLSEEYGPPPPGWDYLPRVIEELFINWANTEGMPSKKRRKKASATEEDPFMSWDAEPEPPKQPVVKLSRAVAKSRAALPKKIVKTEKGNPRCTSGEDCAGDADTGLIRHVMEEGPGDLYCEVCWSSFQERNPELEGVAEEE